MKPLTNLLLLFIAGLVLAGCGDTIQGKSIAEPEVARFHERLNNQEFGTIYTSASEDFRKMIPQERAEALFAAIHRKLGRHKASSLVNWNVKTFNLTTTVVLAYQSNYTDGDATETFTFRVTDGVADLVGYSINSLDMLIK